MTEIIPLAIVSMIAFGLGLAFLTADHASPTSRALAVSMMAAGASFVLDELVVGYAIVAPQHARWLAIPDGIAMGAMLEWLIRVRRTVPAAPGVNTLFGDRVIRSGQLASVIFAAVVFAAPELRVEYFYRPGPSLAIFAHWQFWIFFVPMGYAAFAGFVGCLLFLSRRPEKAEAARVAAVYAAVPMMMLGFQLPADWGAFSIAIGETVMLAGAIRYHLLQGQRGAFLARFLSPEVARMVNERGIASTMQEDHLEISTLCCDLRGFTAYAQANDSRQVLHVLRNYYDAVGQEVAQAGATIKDYAGDGILILIGAPIANPDHAAQALELAQNIRDRCVRELPNWSGPEKTLGIGLGVASGPVTVGVIGASLVLEYTAVGPAVNLASRLCEQADNGEILVDERTRQLTDQTPSRSRLTARAPMQLKGLADPVPMYALSAS
ncbi:MAG: adenylate/guanylate cyclase domain-containing protein [Panacagrimonas sp.]